MASLSTAAKGASRKGMEFVRRALRDEGRNLVLPEPGPEPEPSAEAPAGPISNDGVGLVVVVLALLALGLVMVYSTTAVAADRDPRLHDSMFFLRKQLVWSLVACITLVLASATDYRLLCRLSLPCIGALTLLLIACLFREGRGGARRWLHVGGLGVQPSELGKILLTLYCAELMAFPAARERFRSLVRGLIPIALVIGLVLIAPDFGTGLFLSAIAFAVLVTGGAKLRHLLVLGLPAVATGCLVMLTRFDHVRARIDVFLRPEADLEGKGYQIHQALIALGSGGPFGLGLGESRQKLYFLPDDHTDFILAIVGEELGLVGTLAVAIGFALIVFFGVRIALAARERRGMLVAFGLTFAIALQGAMNLAVVTASMPTKGIALPFVSYGGSALCVAMAAVGILLNVSSVGKSTLRRARS
ncbi:MAG: FtsW/RodA/SpoVE family cell cycle protein [Planctomycetota bacterium]|jgi:cell division protein FtsW